MRCLYPYTVGFKSDGNTISFSENSHCKEFAPFQIPCGRCLECRLEYARQWAVRCCHEAMMHEKNSFITLTYSDKHLKSPKLQYQDFQKFIRKVRDQAGEELSYFVTGEYGETTKRPHWHAIIFNWLPSDATYLRTNEGGDRVFTSNLLDDLWGLNDPSVKPNELGSVTFESAGYVARYAAKKLVHGNDGQHSYEPISKKSTRPAIGRRWLERYWRDVFNHGKCMVRTRSGIVESSIPRYYEKWLKKHHEDAWIEYVQKVKAEKMLDASAKSDAERIRHLESCESRFGRGNATPEITEKQRSEMILKQKFNRLQAFLKGDI